MRVQLELPELTEFANDFPAHWTNIIFTRNKPDTYQVHAIITTYVRHREGHQGIVMLAVGALIRSASNRR
jgi:hypothetical protein